MFSARAFVFILGNLRCWRKTGHANQSLKSFHKWLQHFNLCRHLFYMRVTVADTVGTLLSGTSHYMPLGQSISDVFPVLVITLRKTNQTKRLTFKHGYFSILLRPYRENPAYYAIPFYVRVKCNIISLTYDCWRNLGGGNNSVSHIINTAYKPFHTGAITGRGKVPDLIKRDRMAGGYWRD